MELGSDESTLRTLLHRLVLFLAGFDEADVLFRCLLDDVGSDTVKGLGNVVEREGGIRLGSEDALDAEVSDTRSEALALDCS
jgi:hypothetical protein